MHNTHVNTSKQALQICDELINYSGAYEQEKLQMVLHKHVALKHQGQLAEHVNEVE